MRTTVLLAAASLAAISLTSSATAAEPGASPMANLAASQDEKDIQAVIAAFDNAIQTKDIATLSSLFNEGKIEWLATGHPESRALAAKMTGQAVGVVEEQGAYQFLSDPRLKNISLREEFGPPTIHSDGQLATVTFDYNFQANGAVQNWGIESWQMVKTEQGWKIVHLMFSYNLQQVKPLSQ